MTDNDNDTEPQPDPLYWRNRFKGPAWAGVGLLAVNAAAGPLFHRPAYLLWILLAVWCVGTLTYLRLTRPDDPTGGE